MTPEERLEANIVIRKACEEILHGKNEKLWDGALRRKTFAMAEISKLNRIIYSQQ